MTDPTEAKIRAALVDSPFDSYRSMKQETTMNTKWVPTAGKPAMVMVEKMANGLLGVAGNGDCCYWMRQSSLSEPPTPITPQERAVVDAAEKIPAYWKALGLYGPVRPEPYANLLSALDALAASRTPPDPKVDALRNLIRYSRMQQRAYSYNGQDDMAAHVEDAIRAMEAVDGK